MSEPCELAFVPRKLTVRDLVTQIGNNTSKTEASIQSRTAFNAGEMENSVINWKQYGKGNTEMCETF